MSLPITFSFQCSIRRNGKSSLATDGQPLQFVQLRLRHFGQLVHTPSQQILQQTSPTLISDTLIPFSLWELEDPPFISYFFLFRFLSSYDISAAVCDAIFYNISSFAGQILLAADSNINVNFHIIADVDIVYTHWVDLDPAEDAPAVRKGASTSVIERVMKEKYDGNGGEEKEGDDQCSVCYEQLYGKRENENEKEKEVSRIPCGHMYHKSCILKWLKISNSCPLCRRELEE